MFSRKRSGTAWAFAIASPFTGPPPAAASSTIARPAWSTFAVTCIVGPGTLVPAHFPEQSGCKGLHLCPVRQAEVTEAEQVLGRAQQGVGIEARGVGRSGG